MAQDQTGQLTLRTASTSSQEPEDEAEIPQKRVRAKDYLSNLPNELLDEIFDLAYPIGYPSTGPLSKQLLPYHISGLYSRIKLTQDSNVSTLVDKIIVQPPLGQLVRVLHVECPPSELHIQVELERVREYERFLRNLTKLEDLNLSNTIVLWIFYVCLGIVTLDVQDEEVPTPLPLPFWSSLRRLSIEALRQKPSENPLLLSQSFPNLVTLVFSEYMYPYGPLDLDGYVSLRHLSHLTVTGAFADDSAIASVCSLCPSLRSLKLDATQPEYQNLLGSLPPQIVYLELYQTDLNFFAPVDSFLSHLNHLERLSLGDLLYSSNLLSNISGLLSLERLVLGKGFETISDLLQFVSASTRLASLRELELNLFPVEVGRRFDPDKLEGGTTPNFIREGNLPHVGWNLGYLSFEDEGPFTIEGIEELFELAENEGIAVTGGIVEALEVAKAYLLEVANVSVWRCWHQKSFSPIRDLKACSLSLSRRIPSIDFDSLDPSKLELVRTELPEEGWFSLSLEN